ncbi:MAG: cyclic nucleotide-binding domain-containing protein [Bacteriovoracaceae bacterium]|nr:cyclic nucleotide-binding domain-containing protein [Bacteroidota bacterium]
MGKDFAFKDVFKAKIKPASVEEMLSKIPVFDKLEPKELRQIASIVHRRQYVKGEFVFYQGDPGLGMYVVEKGKVGIVVVGEDGTQKEITEMVNGDFFGEIALLDESARSASVVVKEDSALIGFFRPDLFEIIEKTPKTGLKVVVKLAEMIGERLRNMNNEFSKLRTELELVKQQKEKSDEKASSKKKIQKA